MNHFIDLYCLDDNGFKLPEAYLTQIEDQI